MRDQASRLVEIRRGISLVPAPGTYDKGLSQWPLTASFAPLEGHRLRYAPASKPPLTRDRGVGKPSSGSCGL